MTEPVPDYIREAVRIVLFEMDRESRTILLTGILAGLDLDEFEAIFDIMKDMPDTGYPEFFDSPTRYP